MDTRKYVLNYLRSEVNRTLAALPSAPGVVWVKLAEKYPTVRRICNATDENYLSAYHCALRDVRESAMEASRDHLYAVIRHQDFKKIKKPTTADFVKYAPVYTGPHPQLFNKFALSNADKNNRKRIEIGAAQRFAGCDAVYNGTYGGYPCYRYVGRVGAVQIGANKGLVQLSELEGYQPFAWRKSNISNTLAWKVGDRKITERQSANWDCYTSKQIIRFFDRVGLEVKKDEIGYKIENDVTEYHVSLSTVYSCMRRPQIWRDLLSKKTHEIKKAKKHDEIFRRALDRDIFVGIDDSLAAGNCVPGTNRVANMARQKLGAEGELGGVRVSVLAQIESLSQIKTAVIVAALRQHLGDNHD